MTTVKNTKITLTLAQLFALSQALEIASDSLYQTYVDNGENANSVPDFALELDGLKAIIDEKIMSIED
jgi:hypothetical protein